MDINCPFCAGRMSDMSEFAEIEDLAKQLYISGGNAFDSGAIGYGPTGTMSYEEYCFYLARKFIETRDKQL